MRIGAERVGLRGLIVLSISAVIALVLGLRSLNDQSLSDLQKTLANGPSTTQTVKLGPALSATRYARAAHQLYPGPIDRQTQEALIGFNVSFQHHESQVMMTLSVKGRSDPPVQRTYDASDKIYFVETNMDDDDNNKEMNFGDDGIVATDAQGRIILTH